MEEGALRPGNRNWSGTCHSGESGTTAASQCDLAVALCGPGTKIGVDFCHLKERKRTLTPGLLTPGLRNDACTRFVWFVWSAAWFVSLLGGIVRNA